MKAFSKRVLSLTMATAMVLSVAAVPTTDANAASKYSLTKRTAAYTGKTYNYYLKGVSKSQYAKVSVSGTAKNLVTVKLGSKKIKSSTKINGTGKTLTLKVKASKASSKKYALTAKIYNKKTKKLVKTLKTPTVTVYNNYIKSISGTKSLVVGEAPVTLKAVKKYSQSTATVTWSSSNTAVATITADGIVTAVAAGTSVITAKCGNYTKTTTVTVTEPAKETGISAVVTNAIEGYDNTVFVNQAANLVVTVRDESGKPVPNVSVTWAPTNKGVGNSTYPNEYMNKQPVDGHYGRTTDANGRVTFLIGDMSVEDITDTTAVASRNYTVTVDGNVNAEKTFTGTISYAALSVGTVEKDKWDNGKYTDLVPGEEAASVGYGADDVVYTVPLSHDETYNKVSDSSDYVPTQQVSTTGTNEHEVSFKASANLVIPGVKTETTDVFEKTVAVDEKIGTSGKYETYASTANIIPITEDSSKLRYATLYISNIKLSKYSKLEITPYKEVECKNTAGSTTTVYGAQNQALYAYQIPVSAGTKAVKLVIKSAGQVDANMNDGFVATSIKYVYNDKITEVGDKTYPLNGAKIDWAIENPVYSEVKQLSYADATSATKLAISANSTDSTFTYQVPVFPYTGMAVITEWDKNGKAITYYLAPTENKYKTTSGGLDIFTNTNELSALLGTTSVNNGINPVKAYKATSTEIAAAQGATIKTANDGTSLTINSEKVGFTNVKGTITIPGVDSTVLNDANRYLYTSVQWSPLPKKANENAGYIAINGQQITAIAQLVDKNGNPVTLSGAPITFSTGTTAIAGNNLTSTDSKNVTVVKNETVTDTNGQAKLILSSGTHAEVTEAKAISAATTQNGYDVVLYVGGSTVATEKADLYWVDANLSYYNYPDDAGSFGGASDYQKKVTTRQNGYGSYVDNFDVAKVTVGDNWMFASRAVGDALTSGVYKAYNVNIDGLTIFAKAAASNKGTYTISTDGKGIATGTSQVAQKDFITDYINANSVGKDVTFTVTKGSDSKTIANVGSGTANIDASIKLGIVWEASGASLSLLSTNGSNAVSANTFAGKNVYVKLTDKSGVNGLANKTVKVKVNNNKLVADSSYPFGSGSTATEATITTDAQGIAAIKVEYTSSNEPTIVTVTQDENSLIATTTVNWVAAKAELALLTAKTGADMKTVELTFNNAIEASSVQKDQFDISYKNAADGKTYSVAVTDVKVNDNIVTLTLANTLANQGYTVKVDNAKQNGIVYKLSDVTGETFGTNTYNTVNFVAGAVAPIEITAATAGVGTITVDGIKLPMDEGDASTDGTKMYVTVNDAVAYVNCPVNGSNTGDITQANKVYTGTLPLLGVLKSGDVVNVYYYGGVASYTVK